MFCHISYSYTTVISLKSLKLILILIVFFVFAGACASAAADSPEINVLYVAGGARLFNFEGLTGTLENNIQFNVNYVEGYLSGSGWTKPGTEFYNAALNGYEGYDVVFVDMANFYKEPFDTGADKAAENGTVLISVLTGPLQNPGEPYVCLMPESFTIRDIPELSTGPYSDKQFVESFFKIYKHGSIQYNQTDALNMRNLLVEKIIEQKGDKLCKITFLPNNGNESYSIYVKNGSSPSLYGKTPSRTGYAFVKWMYGENQIEDGFIVTEDITLSAKWRQLPDLNEDGIINLVDVLIFLKSL